MSLFATIDETGAVHLVNHLGLDLGQDPEAVLDRLDQGTFQESDIDYDTGRAGSDKDYFKHIRDVDAASPARFNADPRRLFEASGSAGKVVIFAVRLDTFEQDEETSVFYVGSNDTAELELIRRHILTSFDSLPIAAEYIHRNAFDLAEKYGKDMFIAIQHLGTARLPALFAIKARLDAWSRQWHILPRELSDRLMQAIGRLFPAHLPKRIKNFRDKFEHHLLLRMSGTGIDEARAYLNAIFPTLHGTYFECTAEEGDKAFLHRFAVAGAAIRYRAIHRDLVEDIVSLDIALRRNDRDWFERLPSEVQAPIIHAIYYGHFFCHVFHQDYIVAKGHDTRALERKMWHLLDARGAEYPAEHNVGHLYEAKPSLAKHYRALDPCNIFNPGIGRTSKLRRWR
jgi:D-lactate dehydrogenase